MAPVDGVLDGLAHERLHVGPVLGGVAPQIAGEEGGAAALQAARRLPAQVLAAVAGLHLGEAEGALRGGSTGMLRRPSVEPGGRSSTSTLR